MVVITSFTVPVEGIVLQEDEIRAYFNEKDIGVGTLFITESVLSWCDETKQAGFSLQYPNIALHAARRDPFPALYVMVDQLIELPDDLMPPLEEVGDGDADEDHGEADEDQAYTEFLFSPTHQSAVQRMFSAMNQCQMLHPDPNDSDIYEDASDLIDEDNFEPLPQPQQLPWPIQNAEEGMQELHLGGGMNNGHDSHQNGDGIDYDPEQFADD